MMLVWWSILVLTAVCQPAAALQRSTVRMMAKVEPRVLIVANRLPVVAYRDGEVGEKMMSSFYSKLKTRPRNGLTSALDSFQSAPILWIGWAGLNNAAPTEEVALRTELATRDCVPVMLPEHVFQPYFDGMCNEVLWPLMHCCSIGLGREMVPDHESKWRAYVEANKAFASEVLRTYKPGDVVFVHDYHLMLVPQMLRTAEPSMRIGWFLHVPFPPEQLWRALPERRQLLEGLLAADLLGFHTSEYARNFARACRRITGYGPLYRSESKFNFGRLGVGAPSLGGNPPAPATVVSNNNGKGESWGGGDGMIAAGAGDVAAIKGVGDSSAAPFAASSPPTSMLDGISETEARYTIGPYGTSVATLPIGIDPERFTHAVTSPEVQAAAAQLRQWLNVAPPSNEGDEFTRPDGVQGRRILLGVDRLDYVKGLPEKLEAFERFLQRNPGEIGRTTLVQVAVPTRTNMRQYQEHASKVRQLVTRINAQFLPTDFVPGTATGPPPIVYVERNVPFHELVALYTISDVMLISSFADGLNLVAFEFVASQSHKRNGRQGVLVLSEFTGAAEVFGSDSALLINPFDCNAVAETLRHALMMGPEDRARRWSFAMAKVESNTASGWAKSIMGHLARDLRTRRSWGASKTATSPPELPESEKPDESLVSLPAPQNHLTCALLALERFLPPGKCPVLFLELDLCLAPEASSGWPIGRNKNRNRDRETVRKAAQALPTAVFSGLPIGEVKDQLKLAEPWYAGSHGFEIEGAEGTGVDYRVAAVYRPALQKAKAALEDMLAGIKGTTVHDYRYWISVDFSGVRPYERGGVEAAVGEVLVLSPTLTRRHVKSAIHIQPRMEWNRGTSVEWMLQRFEALHGASDNGNSLFPVYLGGTAEQDEHVYSALRQRGGVGVVVNDRPLSPNECGANFHLRPGDVRQFLELIVHVWQSKPAGR